MEVKSEGAEFEFDPVAWEAQNYDAVEKKFQEVSPPGLPWASIMF